MKISIPTSLLATILLGATTSTLAHPGRDGNKPCPILQAHVEEEAYAAAGQGYQQSRYMRALNTRTGDGGVPDGGFEAVEEDLIALMATNDDAWPADDFGGGQVSYAGLFIRLAWHCSGSYRESDGRGGCDGGRIRFAPEADWEDNANLDKARMLLEPIKEKYGSSLSWGDLIVLGGNAAIKSTGGQDAILGFCGGRIDDADGSNSLILGPSDIQEEQSPCLSLGLQGDCLSVNGTALGPTTVGLIYVNPGGPVTDPNNPIASGVDIRRAFSRMGFDDQTSTILIGGGHALGKAHGACNNAPCGDGKGNNTFTSGFEGAWTTTPTTWSNQYFNNLMDFNWTIEEGPGGGMQWKPMNADGTAGPDIFMLTTDIALSVDEDYKPYAEMYARDLELHNADFAKAWYRLTSADMGPATRCIGNMVPEPQPFQFTLPASPKPLPDYIPVFKAINDHIAGTGTDHVNGFIKLALNCASTFRSTDYRGGCNGARIRFSPEIDWETNAGLDEPISHLQGIKDENGFDASMADMIVLAGIAALEMSNPAIDIPFCGGYVDAEDGEASEPLAPRFYNPANVTVIDDFAVKGLTMEQGVALFSAQSVGSQYYVDLIATGGSSANYTDEELALLTGDLLPIVETFAEDEAALIEAFTSGWTYMMTADRYLNNRDNACTGVSVAIDQGATPSPVAASPVASPTQAPASGSAANVLGLSIVSMIFSLVAMLN